MKRLTIFICAAALFSGCIKEDSSKCKPGTLNLQFRYETPEGANAFLKDITSVDVVLYDDEYKQIARRRLERTDLRREAATTFEVIPGEYYAVCWGNVGTETKLVGCENGTPIASQYLQTESTECGGSLFYAPYTNVSHNTGSAPDYSDCKKVKVPSGGNVNREMNFMIAHRTLNIYIQNYLDAQEGVNPEMDVTATALAETYDFFMRVDPYRRNYKRTTTKVKTQEGEMVWAKINTPLYTLTDDIFINIAKRSDGGEILKFSLQKYVADNNVAWEADNAMRAGEPDFGPPEVNIWIRYPEAGNAGIPWISEAHWSEIDVIPIWN